MIFKTTIGRLRVIGIAEGVSYLLLLLVAMPLKYALGIPEPVKYFGWIHGMLFILYVIALVLAMISNKWGFIKTVIAFAASLVPLGTFLLDKKLREEELQQQSITSDK